MIDWDNVANYWTGIAAIIVGFLSGVVGPWIVARLNLHAKGLSPADLGRAANRAAYQQQVDERVGFAVTVAKEAMDNASSAKEELKAMTERNKRAREENSQLRALLLKKDEKLHQENKDLKVRLIILEKAVKRIPMLQAEIKKLKAQVRGYKKRYGTNSSSNSNHSRNRG